MRVAVGLFAMLVAFGCGGNSVSEGGRANGGPGGTATNGGSSPTGGDATGGTAAGGTSGTSTGGGTGGANAACSLPMDPGPCEGAERMYAFDSESGLCLPFYYGGCQGNENRFETAEDCYRACDDDDPSLLGPADCSQSTACIAISTSCCEPCEAWRWDMVVGVTTAGMNAIKETKCGPIGCDPCDVHPTFAWFDAVCREGHCVAYDAREMPMTECTDSSECVLRNGLACCELCSSELGGGIVAVNRDPAGAALLCEDYAGSCRGCSSGVAYPVGAQPQCDLGRCTVNYYLR